MTFRNFASAVLIALPVAIAGVSADAGEVVDAAAAVEAAIAAGDFNAWQAANATLMDVAWVQPGLHFNRLLLTSASAVGYGAYDVRPDNVYAVGEKIFVYAEPEGFGFGDLGNGKLEIAFDIDLRVLDGNGALLVELPNFMQLQYQTSGKVREFLANLTVELGTTPAGNYTLNSISATDITAKAPALRQTSSCNKTGERHSCPTFKDTTCPKHQTAPPLPMKPAVWSFHGSPRIRRWLWG